MSDTALPNGRRLRNHVRARLRQILALFDSENPQSFDDADEDGLHRVEVRVGPAGVPLTPAGPPGEWDCPLTRPILLALCTVPEGKRVKGYALATKSCMADDATFKAYVRVLVARHLIDHDEGSAGGYCIYPHVRAYLEQESARTQPEAPQR